MRLRGCALVLAGVVLAAGCGMFDSKSSKRTERRTTANEQRGDRVELNSASRRALADLPGLDMDDADRIIAGRPYKNKNALVRRKVLGEKKFDAIRDRVYVDHEAAD